MSAYEPLHKSLYLHRSRFTVCGLTMTSISRKGRLPRICPIHKNNHTVPSCKCWDRPRDRTRLQIEDITRMAYRRLGGRRLRLRGRWNRARGQRGMAFRRILKDAPFRTSGSRRLAPGGAIKPCRSNITVTGLRRGSTTERSAHGASPGSTRSPASATIWSVAARRRHRPGGLPPTDTRYDGLQRHHAHVVSLARRVSGI